MPEGAVGGVFTARQAYAAGLTRSQVRHALASGRWRRVTGAALAAAQLGLTARHRAIGATLTWPDCTVALRTAALVHGLPISDDGKVHVFVPSRRPSRGALTPHLVPVGARERSPLGPGHLTTRSRTVIDLLGRCDEVEGDRLVAWVASRDLLSVPELEAWLGAHPGAVGNVRRRIALERLRSGAVNVAEEKLHDLLRGAGVVGWEANAALFPSTGVAARADVWFPSVRLVVEVDGWAAHRDRFQADRTRQNALLAAGCTVLRYTWDDLTLRPDHVVREITAMLRSLEHRHRAQP